MTTPRYTEELRPGNRILVTDDPDGMLPTSEFPSGSELFPAREGNPAPSVATIKKITIKQYGYRRTIVWEIETDRGVLEGFEEGVPFIEAVNAGDSA